MITKIPNGLQEIIETFGDINDPLFAERNIVIFDFPYPLFFEGFIIRHSWGHKLAVENFQRALQDILDKGYQDEVKNYGGIYSNRKKRGSNQPSTHSWGIAIDIEPQKYPLGSDLRLPQPIVEIFKSYGFSYGGDWKERPDPMHMELCTGY